MEKRFLLFSALLCLLFVSLTFAATTGKIAGKVTDASTGEGLPGVNIVIVGTQMGAATDINGEYFIINVPPGTYSVAATMIGYKKTTKTNVIVNVDLTTPLNFKLEEEVIEGEEVTVVAERPVVEVDLTASKNTMSADDIDNMWTNTVEEAISVQSGVSMRGSIRGGLGLDVAYMVDGMDVRDGGTNSNYVEMNASAVDELEVLTGGFNAEYGRATGAVVNIITKASTSGWHGSISTRMRPAGKYHWGRNLYSEQNAEYTKIDRAWFEANSQNLGGKWIDYWTEANGTPPTPEFNWNYYQEKMTPEDVLAGYTDRSQWDFEGTVTGPITEKLGVMVSGRYLRGVSKWVTALEYEPEWNGTLKLKYNLTSNTNITLMGIHQGSNTAEKLTLPYSSNYFQRHSSIGSGRVGSPYNGNKFNPYGAAHFWSRSGFVRPPMYVRNNILRARVLHTFSPSTFLEFNFTYNNLDYESNFRNENFDEKTWTVKEMINWRFNNSMTPPVWFYDSPGPVGPSTGYWDALREEAETEAFDFKVDLTSQVTNSHLIKAGIEIIPQKYFYIQSTMWPNPANPAGPDQRFNPYEASAYIQDKIELGGMVVNVGLRADMYNINKDVNYTIFDPYAMSPYTDGNISLAYPSLDPDGEYAVKTKTRWALSPRIGISHPITSTTVLHFMYGHFQQRPTWNELGRPFLLQTPSVRNDPRYVDDPYNISDEYYPEVGYSYHTWLSKGHNPGLVFQKTIQYEVGFDQAVGDLFNIDMTIFYRDAHDLTQIHKVEGRASEGDWNFVSPGELRVRLWPDFNNRNSPRGIGQNIFLPVNGGRMNTRGLEATLRTHFLRNLQLDVIYNMTWVSAGRYGPSEIYREFELEDGTTKKNGIDRYYGFSENFNETWAPRNTLKFNLLAYSPRDFGPSLGGFKPLADWNLNVYYSWFDGARYTYDSPLTTEIEKPLSRQWDDLTKTNLKLSKGIALPGNLNAIFSVQVINLFDQNVLRLLSGNDLAQYVDYGIFPQVSYGYKDMEYNSVTETEDNLWNAYDNYLNPREIFFGLTLEF